MEKCQRCGKEDNDKRVMLMGCGYDMGELRIFIDNPSHKLYKLEVCKSCRRTWMLAIKHWFNTSDSKFEGSGIFVRHLGDDIEVSEKEYERMKNEG